MKISHLLVIVFGLIALVSVSSFEFASPKTFATKLNISSLEVKNTNHETLTFAATNQQLAISGLLSGLGDNRHEGLHYVLICEIRDIKGVTIYLDTQTGELDENAQTAFEFSWQPKIAGDYEIRAIVMSDYKNPELLTHLDVLQTKVSDWGGILDLS